MRFSRPRQACRTRWTRWSADRGNVRAGAAAVLADPGIDAVIVLFVPPVVASAQDVADAVGRAAGRREAVLASLISGAAMTLPPGVTNFAYPESAGRALGIAAARAEWLRRPAGSTPSLEGIDRDAARSDRRLRLEVARAPLDPAGTPGACSGLRHPRRSRAVAGQQPRLRLQRSSWGCPQSSSAVPGAHKTETGGVAVGLESEAEVREAAERIGLPVLVRPLISGSAELLAGVVGPGLRAARRLRSGRRLCRADRAGGLPHRAAHGRRRPRARDRGKAGALVAGSEARRPPTWALEDLPTGCPSSATVCRSSPARSQSGHCRA